MLFPVKVPYTISADISKYAGSAFAAHPEPYYLEEKRKELAILEQDICGARENTLSLIQEAGAYIGQPGLSSLTALALHLEEDIAILHKGVLEAICFCFPSGFVPTKNLGLDFFQMHMPVADGDKLRASGPKVSSLIAIEGAMFRRYVWGISSLGSLSQHPGYERPIPKGIEDLYFRTETQTTVGLADESTLFFVKVDMHPLSFVWEDLEKRKVLIESVKSMSDAVLAYKNMQLIKDVLIGDCTR